MAVDSAVKRASIARFIIPDGTLDQGDRQTIAGMYSGILATASSVATGVVYATVTPRQLSVSVTERQLSISATPRRLSVTITTKEV